MSDDVIIDASSNQSVTPNQENLAQPPENQSQKNFVPVSFNFYGNTSEFFGIWIVNVLLTILTLGVYSAWAKVRTNQYFYGNTELDNHRFAYLAKPLDILKGRIVAVVLFTAYYFLSSAYPKIGLAFALALLVATPWLICASMRFNLRMTSYRNVRFDFTGKYLQAFWYLVILPIICLIPFGLGLPYAFCKIDRFLISNVKYGDKQMKATFGAQEYYITVLILMCISSAIMMVVMMIMAMLGFSAENMVAEEGVAAKGFSFMLIIGVVLYVLFINGMTAYYQVTIRNHILNNSRLDNIAAFTSNYKMISYTVLLFTNFIAIVCSFGLAYPWIKIRTTNYAITHTDVALTSDKENISNLLGSSTALGDEVANIFDIDVALI